MTEYDYSPDAWERYIETQHRIANWVDGTLKQQPCNAFAPTTPHINFLELTDNLEREQRHKYDYPKKERPSAKKDRRYSHDQYNQDRKYRSDTEEEDYTAPRARRHRDSQASASHVSSRHHVRSSSRQESHVSSREEKYRPTTSSRQRELSSSSREKDRSDSEYRSSSRTSYTTPTSSRSQSRQSGAVVTGQGYVLVEKEQAPKVRHTTPTSTRASTPTSAKVPYSRPRALSHAAPITSPTRSRSPIVSITTTPTKATTRPRGASRSQTSPLTLDLPPPGQPHVIGNDYAGYPISRPSATSPGAATGTTSGGLYPYQQTSPTSAPPLTRQSPTPTNVVAPKPMRSQTTPGYEGRNSYDSSYSWHGHLPTHAPSPAKGSSSLLKRMFTGLTLGKSPGRSSPKYPVPKEVAKEGGKRVMRKRSTSF